jgi:hypothetical protein
VIRAIQIFEPDFGDQVPVTVWPYLKNPALNRIKTGFIFQNVHSILLFFKLEIIPIFDKKYRQSDRLTRQE